MKYISGKNVIDEKLFEQLAPQIKRLWKPLVEKKTEKTVDKNQTKVDTNNVETETIKKGENK